MVIDAISPGSLSSKIEFMPGQEFLKKLGLSFLAWIVAESLFSEIFVRFF